MYKPTSPQSSFFEPCYLFSSFLPENDWSNIYRDKIWPLIDENKFKHFYKEEGGAPNKSIRTKLSILIFMSMETLNWRQAEFMFGRRLDWIHATHSAMGDTFIDHTTLFKFYLQLENDDKAFLLFKDLTTKFLNDCGVSTKKQRTDSFFMKGWLAILSRYGLFKETIRSFLRVLRKHQNKLYQQISKDLSRDYLEDNFDLTEKDREKAQRKVKTMAQDLFRLKNAFENHEQICGYSSFKTLVTIFEQQCEIVEDGDVEVKTKQRVETTEDPDNKSPKTKVEPKSKPKIDSSPSSQLNKDANNFPKNESSKDLNEHPTETNIAEIKENSLDEVTETTAENSTTENASQNTKTSEDVSQVKIRKAPLGNKIISSPYNTDAEYTKKRKQTVVGHKVFVTETCDPENSIQFITDINLERANHSDSEELPKIVDRVEENGFGIEEMNADAGFVNGHNILESEKRGVDLVGPSAGRSLDLEEFSKKDRPLDAGDFKVSIDDQTKELTIVECPNKQSPTDQRRSEKTGGLLVHFALDACEQCKMRSRCPVDQGKKFSTLKINEEQYAGASRNHRYKTDTDYRKKCAVRAGAESLVNEVANSHNSRRSKHKTEERSRLQSIFSAIACNTKRYLNHMVQSDQKSGEIAMNL